MAHFAKIGDDNIVEDVIVIDNSVVDPDTTGTDDEQLGKDYIANVLKLKGTWVQTSYNHNIRGKYAGIGHTYDSELDKFKPPKPYPSWTWDNDSSEWVAPVAHPLADVDPNDEDSQPSEITSKPADEIWFYDWNEDNTAWELRQWTQADADADQGENLGD